MLRKQKSVLTAIDGTIRSAEKMRGGKHNEEIFRLVALLDVENAFRSPG